MYVCVCKAVPQKCVQDAIEGGAETREDVTKACGAGGDCGSCHRYIEKMIDQHQQRVIAAADLVRKTAA